MADKKYDMKYKFLQLIMHAPYFSLQYVMRTDMYLIYFMKFIKISCLNNRSLAFEIC